MKKIDAKKEMDKLIEDTIRMKLSLEQANYYKLMNMWLILTKKINEMIERSNLTQ